eukprot:265999_1
MRFSGHKSSVKYSKWFPFSKVLSGICVLLLVSVTLNVMLLSNQSISLDDDVPQMDYSLQSIKRTDCGKSNIVSPHTPLSINRTTIGDHSYPQLNTHHNQSQLDTPQELPDICGFDVSLKGKIYLYDLPYTMREVPRGQWYRRFAGLTNYNDTQALNFGFGKKMYSDWRRRDIHLTHMHALEVIWNERLKVDKYYLTDNPEEAMLFHIPYPFALHYRFWERTESERITRHHAQIQNYMNEDPVYQKYFVNAETRRPHILTFGRIAYETVRLENMKSQFFSINGDLTKYWILSIDRNCHGDPPSCWKRVSMPHPSNYHPKDVRSLKIHVKKVKQAIEHKKKTIFVSFCGYVRTNHRNISRDTCSHFKRKSKWRHSLEYDDVCVFDDGLDIKKTVGKNKLKVQHAFAKRCYEMYEKSVFCIQDGADSTTRKGLWDGIIAGCIPVFLKGAMTDEFDCYGNGLYPWYVVQQREFYVNQLLSLPPEYIKLLQSNLLRLIPKILYTNGNAGFSDAFDVIWHCLMRKTSFANRHFNPECTTDYLVNNYDKMYDFDEMLGYDKLYQYLDI